MAAQLPSSDPEIRELQISVALIEKSLADGRVVMNALKFGQERHEEHIIRLLDEMAKLHKEYAANAAYEKSRFDSLMAITETNSNHIGQVNIALEQLTKDTSGLITAWEAGEGVVEFASVLGRLGKWIASIGFIGVAYMWLKQHF